MKWKINYQKKTVKLREGVSNKRRRRKEWWNSELTELWNNLCEAEENWLNSSGRDKQNSRHLYIRLRKNFDRCVQRAKRNIAYNRQIEIEH